MKHLIDKNFLLILSLYLLITIIFLNSMPQIYTSILNPIFWLCILVFAILNIKSNYIRLCSNKKYLLYMIIILLSHIILFFFIGFIFGFSKSPYNHELISIFKNVVLLVFPIISIELLRILLITKIRKNIFFVLLITLLLLLFEIDYGSLFSILMDKRMLFEYVCSNIIPLIAFSLLYTYLSLKTLYVLPLLYRLSSKLLIILSPILPNINWFVTGSVNILLSASVYALFKYVILKDKKVSRRKSDTFTKISYILTIIFCSAIVCFMLGFFKYEPISIISNSMHPYFSRGDVVIYEKMNEDSLSKLPKGTIIIYTINGQNIAHRIVNILRKNNETFYQTKGDYNNTLDQNLVKIAQIKGIYKFHIKFIGFPSVWLYEYFSS